MCTVPIVQVGKHGTVIWRCQPLKTDATLLIIIGKGFLFFFHLKKKKKKCQKKVKIEKFTQSMFLTGTLTQPIIILCIHYMCHLSLNV